MMGPGTIRNAQQELNADARLPPMAYLLKRGFHLPAPHELDGIDLPSIADQVRRDVEQRQNEILERMRADGKT